MSTVFLRWDYKGNRWMPSWRGRIEEGGKVREVKLAVRWEGKPPAKGKRHGDKAFEDSRRRAQNELNELANKRIVPEEALRVAEQIQRLKYGNDSNEADTPLDGLFDAWKKAPHAKERSEKWERVAASTISVFVEWAKKHAPKEKTAGAVSSETIDNYFNERESRGVSGRTMNVARGILSAVFRELAPHGDAIKSLSGRPKSAENTVHRRALSPEDLAKLFDAAREVGEDWFGDLVVVAGCTALRRTDAACLRWRNVDLSAGWVEVRPGKNKGEVAVEIPLLPPLREVLARRAKGGTDDDAFVIPEAAEMASHNPQGLNWRLGKAIALAGLGTETAEDIPGGVSRERRPSVLGWHALRTSWATAAASAGMPLETICEVTGHSSTKTLLRHYVQLDKERKRAEVSGKLPGGFMGVAALPALPGPPDDWEEVRALADALTKGNAATTRRKILAIAARHNAEG